MNNLSINHKHLIHNSIAACKSFDDSLTKTRLTIIIYEISQEFAEKIFAKYKPFKYSIPLPIKINFINFINDEIKIQFPDSISNIQIAFIVNHVFTRIGDG